ncbi:Rrf2 family transcriptional regulator [Chitinibacter sp. SCUT-21]|uniref:RrF2 family transcriptional regulator n=1 Tax=Chitinibacter sp. SCUT-21 TaxID=2970891 RepID=UPI0035A5E7E5
MRLNVFTDYCLRSLIYICLKEGQIVTRAEIAQAYAISDNHLMKVVHFLAQEGFVQTLRGKGGGIRLAREPHLINLGTLVRASEEDSPIVECFDPEHNSCNIVAACRLKHILHEAVQALYLVLDHYTLADLVQNRHELTPIFAIQLPTLPAKNIPSLKR